MEIILKYFPELNENQKEQIAKLYEGYKFWNEKINLISRKDIDNLYEHHILHSLILAKIITFKDETKIMDLGTGGGLPGIPLAIFFPNTQFYLVDSISKKIKVVKELIKELNLKNATAIADRAENLKIKFDFITVRAVAPINKIITWTSKNISSKNFNQLPNGFFLYKGGNIDNEIRNFNNRATIFNINKWYHEDYYSDKKIIHIIG